MTNETKTLLLATTQFDLVYLRLDEEVREIEEKIQPGSFRDSFDLIQRSAVRVSDLGTLLLKHRPRIVHFSGHGIASEGISFEDDTGNIKLLGVDELAGILRLFKNDIRITFLNVCDSKPHAEAIAHDIDYVIGMDGEIRDKSAIVFAASFYQALAFGLPVKEAFEMAKEQLNIRGLEGSGVPVLLVRQGVDASQPFLGHNEEVVRVMSGVSRLVTGTASADDRLLIQRGLINGHVIFDEIESYPSSEGDGERTFNVVTRDSQLHVGLTPSDYLQVKEQLFPPPQGIAPPFPPFVFIGREGAVEDIKQLLGYTKKSSNETNITVVRGWPGVGKTSLVGVIGRDPEIAKTFPQGVLWTSLEQSPNVLSEMARWGRALGTDEILKAPTPKEATAQLAALLRHRRMLLIVDDVWDRAHAVPFTEILGENCALLVTTRMTSVAENLTTNDERVYVLPVLTVEDSLKLLRILVPAIVEQYQDECRELVRDLECLPLALHVAGALLRSEAKFGWGVTDLLKEIREEARLMPEPAPNDRIEGEKIPTVSALLMKSTNKLDEFTRECFAYLGAFAPKPATLDLAAMKAVWDVKDARPLVRKLVDHGLLEPVGDERFQMHRILVDHAKSLCSV
jgi:hypothetical protein